jgi:nicotinamidase-related amidase
MVEMDLMEPITRSSSLINLDDCFILIIDVQKPFLTKGLSKSKKQTFITKIKHLLKLATVLKIPIVITAEDIQNNGTIPEEISNMLPANQIVHNKFIYSCWGQQDIQNAIKIVGKSVAVLCGLETDVCVSQTSLDLLSNNYKVVILGDISYSRNQYEHEIGLKRLENSGAIISSLKTWQEEITAGIQTETNVKLRNNKLSEIP